MTSRTAEDISGSPGMGRDMPPREGLRREPAAAPFDTRDFSSMRGGGSEREGGLRRGPDARGDRGGDYRGERGGEGRGDRGGDFRGERGGFRGERGGVEEPRMEREPFRGAPRDGPRDEFRRDAAPVDRRGLGPRDREGFRGERPMGGFRDDRADRAADAPAATEFVTRDFAGLKATDGERERPFRGPGGPDARRTAAEPFEKRAVGDFRTGESDTRRSEPFQTRSVQDFRSGEGDGRTEPFQTRQVQDFRSAESDARRSEPFQTRQVQDFRSTEGEVPNRLLRGRAEPEKPMETRQFENFRDADAGSDEGDRRGGFRRDERGPMGRGGDDRRGGMGDDRRGGYDRGDDRRGGFDRDDRRGGFDRDDRRGGMGDRRNDSRYPTASVKAPAVMSHKVMQDYIPSSRTAKPVATTEVAAPTAPVVDDAVSRAASIDLELAKTTLSKQLSKLLDDILEGAGGKDAEKKQVAATRSMASTPQLAEELVRLIAVRALDCEKQGGRKQLAVFINTIRTAKPGVLTDAQVASGCTVALNGVFPSVSEDAVQANLEDARRLLDFFTFLTAPADKGKAKGPLPLPASAFPSSIAQFIAAASPIFEAAAAAARAEDEDSAAAEPPASVPLDISTASPGAWGDAPEASKPSTTPATATDATVQQVANELLEEGLKGAALTNALKSRFAGYPNRAVAAAFLTAVVQRAQRNNQFTAKAPWTAKEEYGAALSSLCFANADSAVGALYALQAFLSEFGFQKGLLANIFMQMYQNDIISEDSFLAWRDDASDSTPGKEKALTHTQQFFDYLKDDEEESDEDPDVADALKDIIRPNNMQKLR